VAWLGAGSDVDIAFPVEGLPTPDGAAGCRRHRDLAGAVRVIPAAPEHRVGLFADLYVPITRGSCARRSRSLRGEVHPRAVVDARGDVHRHRPARADPAFAGAFGARIAQEGAVAAAVGAGGGGHDVAEEGAGDPLHAAPALTGGAGGRVGARAGAG